MKKFFKVVIGDRNVFFMADNKDEIVEFYKDYPFIYIKSLNEVNPNAMFEHSVTQEFVFINDTEKEMQLKHGTAFKTADGQIKLTINLN